MRRAIWTNPFCMNWMHLLQRMLHGREPHRRNNASCRLRQHRPQLGGVGETALIEIPAITLAPGPGVSNTGGDESGSKPQARSAKNNPIGS
jgi:hypothetical protein